MLREKKNSKKANKQNQILITIFVAQATTLNINTTFKLKLVSEIS